MENRMSQEKAKDIENIIKEGRFQFAIKCLNDVMKIKPKKNVAFSPPCIYKGLLITYLMLRGEIEERLRQILCLTNMDKLDLINYGRHKLYSQNASVVYPYHYYYDVNCFIKDDIRLKDALLHFLHAPVVSLVSKSSNSEQLINYINNRVLKKAVDGYIRDPVSLAVDGQHIELILMTTICGKFQKFQYSAAGEADTLNMSTLIDQQNISYFNYKLSMHVNEFPYEIGKMSLFVFRSASRISGKWTVSKDANTDICDLIKRLSSSEGIGELRLLLNRKISLSDEVNTPFSFFPVFDVEKNLKIRELLQALDAEQLLMPDAIDVHGFSIGKENCPSVHIGNVVHRSRVKVTKKDIVAGAMTLIHTGQESSSGTKVVDVNYHYPFVWLIYDKLRQEILFVGAFNKFANPVSGSK